LGDVLVQQEQIEQAIVTYQIALQIQPKNGDAIARLQAVLLKQDPDCNVQQYLSNISHSLPIPRVDYNQSDLKF
jgi:O-antigen biosynthesis protein